MCQLTFYMQTAQLSYIIAFTVPEGYMHSTLWSVVGNALWFYFSYRVHARIQKVLKEGVL